MAATTIQFSTPAEALEFFATASAPNAAPGPVLPDAAPVTVEADPVEAPADPAASAPEAVRPGALARLFGGGQLAEAQQQLAATRGEIATLTAEVEQLRAANATLLQAANYAAARLGAQPQQVAAQVADITASLGVPAAVLPAAEPVAQDSPSETPVLEQYEAIKDPAEKQAFYKANKNAIFLALSERANS